MGDERVGSMEMMAGVWELVTFLATTRRGLRWLILGLAILNIAGVLIALVSI